MKMSAPTRRKEDFKYRLPEDGYERRFYDPTLIQMYSAVKGDDRYQRPSVVKPILIGVLILLGAFVIGWFFIG